MERASDRNTKEQQQNEQAMDDKLAKMQETVNALENGMASIVLLLQQGNNNPPAAAAAPPPPPAAAAAPQEGTCVFVIFVIFFKILPMLHCP